MTCDAFRRLSGPEDVGIAAKPDGRLFISAIVGRSARIGSIFVSSRPRMFFTSSGVAGLRLEVVVAFCTLSSVSCAISITAFRAALSAARIMFGAELDTRQAALTSIFLSGFCVPGILGSVTVNTPFLKVASILSASTPSGSVKERSNAP